MIKGKDKNAKYIALIFIKKIKKIYIYSIKKNAQTCTFSTYYVNYLMTLY